MSAWCHESTGKVPPVVTPQVKGQAMGEKMGKEGEVVQHRSGKQTWPSQAATAIRDPRHPLW